MFLSWGSIFLYSLFQSVSLSLSLSHTHPIFKLNKLLKECILWIIERNRAAVCQQVMFNSSILQCTQVKLNKKSKLSPTCRNQSHHF